MEAPSNDGRMLGVIVGCDDALTAHRVAILASGYASDKKDPDRWGWRRGTPVTNTAVNSTYIPDGIG